MTGADLSESYLEGVNLPKDVIYIKSEDWYWSAIVMHDYIRIGCQYHATSAWEAFSDDEIAKMDNDTSAFWLENKHKIMAAIKTAKPEVRKATYRSA